MKAFLNALWALAILIAGCIGLALAARKGLSWLFAGVDPTIGAAIVAAAATTVVSVLGVTLGRYLERRQQIDLEIRERKIPMYKQMIDGLIGNLLNSEEGDTSALAELLTKITPELITWASDDVISAWTKFRRQEADSTAAVMFQLEDLLKAVRKDLGHASRNLAKGDLLGLFINDIHEYLGES